MTDGAEEFADNVLPLPVPPVARAVTVAALVDRVGISEFLPVDADASALDALDQLLNSGSAEAPVARGSHVLGVFSLASLTRAVVQDGLGGTPLDSIGVTDALDRPVFVRLDEPLEELNRQLEERDSVLVGTPSACLGSLSRTDLLRYYAVFAEPFMWLREIELSLRDVIESQIPEGELAPALLRVTRREDCQSLVEATFRDLIDLLRFSDVYSEYFSGVADRQVISKRLSRLPEIRNSVFHFRTDFNSQDREYVRHALKWTQAKCAMLGLDRGSS